MSILAILVVCLAGAIVGATWLRRRAHQQRSRRRNYDLHSSSDIGRQQVSDAASPFSPDSEAKPNSEPQTNPDDLIVSTVPPPNKISEPEADGLTANNTPISTDEFFPNPDDAFVRAVAGESADRADTISATDLHPPDRNAFENIDHVLKDTNLQIGQGQCRLEQERVNPTSTEPATTKASIHPASEAKVVSGSPHSEITDLEVPLSTQSDGTADTNQPSPQVGDGAGAGVVPAKVPIVDLEPRKYRPKLRIYRNQQTRREGDNNRSSPNIALERALPIELQLLTQLGGTYRLSLVPRKRHVMPDHLPVRNAQAKFELMAMGRKWYQGLSPANISDLLTDGIIWTSADPKFPGQWSLSGRQLYVLSPREELDLSGFVSTNRLALGEEHVVLCLSSIASSVREILGETCELQPREVVGRGIPDGWVAYTHVFPTKPLPVGTTAHILDALRPIPDLNIKLRGGIRIQRSVWLSGYPPEIKIVGDITHAQFMLIDGQPASVKNSRFLWTGSSDTLGPHVVTIDGKARTYSIAEPNENWEKCAAYSFSIPGRGHAKSTCWTICGALVSACGSSAVKQFFVPPSNPILIGATPGQIQYCEVRKDIRTDLCPVAPDFDAVWAVPSDALHTNKATTQIKFVGKNFCPPNNLPPRSSQLPKHTLRWCTAILDSSRKGLAIEPHSEAASRLWNDYKKVAKRLWRAHR